MRTVTPLDSSASSSRLRLWKVSLTDVPASVKMGLEVGESLPAGSGEELLTDCVQGWAVRKQWWGDGAISTTPSRWIATPTTRGMYGWRPDHSGRAGKSMRPQVGEKCVKNTTEEEGQALFEYNSRHLMTRPCHKWRGGEEGRHGATPRHFQHKEKENGWPHPPTGEWKTRTYNALVPENDRRKRGRPKKTWRSTFKEDLNEMGISWHGARRIASGHDRWRLLVARCSEMNRWT